MFENNFIKITKAGNVKWKSQDMRFSLIIRKMKDEGYNVRISEDEIRKNKYYLSRSGAVVSNYIESSFRTIKQRDKAVREFNKYEQYHTSIREVNRDMFEYEVIREMVGNEINFNFWWT